MLDPSAADMFEAGNYRRRRTRRQRHAKMLLSGQFHQQSPSAFTIYPELMQRAHLQQAHAFALSLEHQQKQQQQQCHEIQQNSVIKADYDDSENSDNDAATAEQSHDDETTKHINALDVTDHTTNFPSSTTTTTSVAAANYLSNLDKLLKNQFLHQINFHAAINECNRGVNHRDHSNTDLMTRDNDSKMNLKSTNFTIENLIRK